MKRNSALRCGDSRSKKTHITARTSANVAVTS